MPRMWCGSINEGYGMRILRKTGHDKNFNSIASMSMPELNKYVGSYKREIDRNGDNSAINKSIAMCYLKLKQYKQAEDYFKKRCWMILMILKIILCGGLFIRREKAFLSNKSTITQIETFINDAISIESKGVYYYFMAYIKFDYYKRKSFRTKPDYIECLNQAIRNNLSRMDAEQMFKIIGVTMPHELAF